MIRDSSSSRGEGVSEATPETSSALRWLHDARAEAELLCDVARLRRRRRQRTRAAAAAVVAMGVVAVFWMRPSEGAPMAADVSPAGGTATAIVSIPQRERLPDGSIVELKSGAVMRAEFLADARRITLVQGEAHFQVVTDPARPFIVTAGAVAVRAVGTAFSVQYEPAAVEVLVTEGRVAVERSLAVPPPGTEETPATVLDAGGRALIPLEAGGPPLVSQVEQAALAKRLAWRVPRLEFSRTPLAEAIVLMNQHGGNGRNLRIDAAPANLAQITLSGFLAANNVEGLLHMLEASAPVDVEQVGDTLRMRERAR